MRQCKGISDQNAHRAVQRQWYLHVAHHPTHSSKKMGWERGTTALYCHAFDQPWTQPKYRLISTGIGQYSTQHPRQTAHSMIPSKISPSASGRYMLTPDHHFHNHTRTCNSSVRSQSSPTLRTSDQTRKSPTPAAHLSVTYKQWMMTTTVCYIPLMAV